MATQSIEIRVLDKTSNALEGISKKLKGLNSGLLGINRTAALVGSALSAVAGGNFLRQIVATTSKFQDLRIALNSVTGSAKAGGESFDFIKKFAETSIFEVDQLTGSFIQLKAAGVEPTAKLLTTFQDVASVTTDRVGALQAMTDLFARTTGGGLGLIELERLATRGINVFGILEEELGITRLEVAEFGKTAEGAAKIKDALLKGLDTRFGGSAAASMNSLSGVFSNFQDAVKNAMDTMGSQGLLQVLTDVTKEASNFISTNQDMVIEIGRNLTKGALIAVETFKLLIANIGFLGKAFVLFFGLKIGLAFASIAAMGAAKLIQAMILLTKVTKQSALIAYRHPYIALAAVIVGGLGYITGAFEKLADAMGLGEAVDTGLDAIADQAKNLGEYMGLNIESFGKFGQAMEGIDEKANQLSETYKKNLETNTKINDSLGEQNAKTDELSKKEQLRLDKIKAYESELEKELANLKLSTDERELQEDIQKRLNDLAKALGVKVTELTEDDKQRTLELTKQLQLQKQLNEAQAALPSIVSEVEGGYTTGSAEEIAMQEKLKHLRTLRDEEGADREKYEQLITGIEEKYARERLKNSKARVQEQLDIIKSGRMAELDLRGMTSEQIVDLTVATGREVLGELAKHNKAAFMLNKAFAIRDAIISTAQGISKALALGPLGIPLAVLIGALGAVQIATIAKQQYTGRARGGNVDEGTPYMVGERGAEMFVPQQRGTIISAESMRNMGRGESGARPVNVTFEITANDTEGFDDLIVKRRGLIINLINTALNERGKEGITS